MASSQNQTAPPQQDADEKGWYTLTGDLCLFNLGPDRTNRRYFIWSGPFGVARKIFKVEPYDPVKNQGEQRARIDSHVRKLKRAMMTGAFTPAPWAGGVRTTHLKNLEVDDKRKKVKLRVSDRHPLACLDGGHRFESLEDLRKEAGDTAGVKVVDGVTISVQVYLDPKFIREDFDNLQAGRAVNKSQRTFMKDMNAHGNDPKNGPYRILAQKVAWALNKLPEPESFLSNDVNFTGGGGGRVEYASITTLGGSDVGTSIAGGAKIALYQGFKQFLPTEDNARDFLVECYKTVWQGIHKYDDQQEFTDPMDGSKQRFPSMLMPGRMLRPNRLGGRGTKGGTGLLIMLGNMLAFRMLAVRKKADTPIPPAEVKRLVEAAREVLDNDVKGGGSGPAKREATGEFVRLYFEDVVRRGDGDEHDERKSGAIDGVPTLLCDVILTRSTLNVPKDVTEYIPADEIEPEPETPRMSDPDQTDPEWNEEDGPPDPALDTDEEEFQPPKPSKGNGGKKKPVTGSMG